MTDKTPSSQEACVAYEGGGESHFFPAPERCKCGKKTEPHLQDSKETPTVKEVGERLIKEHKPLFDALAEERDAKKCTCPKTPKEGAEKGVPMSSDKCNANGYHPAHKRCELCRDPDCPVHGDGAKKETTCICENPNTYSGRNMNCPIHPFKRDAAPRDSLDEIKKCLGEYAEKYYLAAEENDPSPDLDYYVTKVQDWHITQVRELLDELRQEMDFETCQPDCTKEQHARHTGSWETYNQNQQVIDRALERLDAD